VLRAFALVAAALLVSACGNDRPNATSNSSTGAAGAGAGDAGSVFGAGDDPWVASPVCAVETQSVYVIDATGGLRRFDPPSGRLRDRRRGRVDVRADDRPPLSDSLYAVARRSMRAGTYLCHGVPTNGSRSSTEVSSFGATPVTARPFSPG
jgi:hypothetical protein